MLIAHLAFYGIEGLAPSTCLERGLASYASEFNFLIQSPLGIVLYYAKRPGHDSTMKKHVCLSVCLWSVQVLLRFLIPCLMEHARAIDGT